MCARGSGLRAARGTREGLGGLRRRETGRALEAGLREDRRKLVLSLEMPRGRPHPAVPLDGPQTKLRRLRARLAPGQRLMPRRQKVLERGPGHRLRVQPQPSRPPDLGDLVKRRASAARAAPRPSKSGVPFIDSVNARRLFSSIPPRALHNLTSSLRIIYTHWLFFGLIAMR